MLDTCRLSFEKNTHLLVALIITFAAPQFGIAASSAISRGELKPALDNPELQSQNATLLSYLRSSPPNWKEAKALVEKTDRNTIDQEFLLSTYLVQARSGLPDEETKEFVLGLTVFQSQTFVWHEEGPLPVEAFPVAQLAAGTVRYWDVALAKEKASRDLLQGDYGVLNYLRSPGSAGYSGTMQALRVASPIDTEAAKKWLLEYATIEESYEALAYVALQTQDGPLAQVLLEIDRGPLSLTLLRGLSDHFTAAQTLIMLRTAMNNPTLASAAAFEIDGLRGTGVGPSIDTYMFDLLADPLLGGTAAMSIATHGGVTVLTQVAGILSDGRSTDQHQARAVLTLTLANTPFCRAALAAASNGGDIRDDGLRREVLKWLAN
jgi:hypothetical protein